LLPLVRAQIPPILDDRPHQRCTPESCPMRPPSRTGLDIGRVMRRGTTSQHSPRGLVRFSRHKRGTFLSVSEIRKTQPLATPAPAQRAPHILRRRPRCYPMASAALSRPRAALATVPGPVTLAKTGLSDFEDRIWSSGAARGGSAAALAPFRRAGRLPPDHSS
jgi:hypothetical protein